MRFVRQLIRSVVLAVLSIAAIVSTVVGVWGRMHPDSIMIHRRLGPFSLNTTCGPLALGADFGKPRHLSAHMTGMQDGIHFHAEYRHAVVAASGPRFLRLGPLEYEHQVSSHREKCVEAPPKVCLEKYMYFYNASSSARLRTPAWLPALLFAAYPFWAFVRGPWRRRRRKAKGLCLRCGYNLTGNVTNVCPECGAPVVKREPAVVTRNS